MPLVHLILAIIRAGTVVQYSLFRQVLLCLSTRDDNPHHNSMEWIHYVIMTTPHATTMIWWICNLCRYSSKTRRFNFIFDKFSESFLFQVNYRIRSINSRAYYLKTGSWKSEVRGEINRRAYGENKKAGRKQCLQCLIRTRVLFERIRYVLGSLLTFDESLVFQLALCPEILDSIYE